jgi:CDP-glycerol glycerophosphotransferase
VDRLDAVERVIRHLDEHGPDGARDWYEESLLRDDLRYHLELLDQAGEEYRALFAERVNAILDAADPALLARLPARERRAWELVRARRIPELVAHVRAEREAPPPLRVRVARRIPERHRRRLRGLLQGIRPPSG